MPESRGSNQLRECLNFWTSLDKHVLASPPPSWLSILWIVSLYLSSRVGRPNAFPRNWPQPLLGLRWWNIFPISTYLATQFFYSYNYNVFTTNLRYRTFRNVFPFLVAYIFADAYSSYRKQILKINLFDEYCYLRAQELASQNEYLLDHPGIWWLMKTWKNQCGGLVIFRKLWAKFTDRPIKMRHLTTKTQSYCCRTSSTGMWIHRLFLPWSLTTVLSDRIQR